MISLTMTVFFFINIANATLISDLSERDWQVLGDSAITYDRSTGLEWLDLSVTNGNSIIGTESETFFGDFRWATHGEIETIFDAVVLGSGYRTSTSVQSHNAAILFINLFSPNHGANITLGVSRGSEISQGLYGLGYVEAPTSSAVVRDPLSHCCWTEQTSQSNVGSWLVRISQVPEPSILVIFALGMIGLASCRFNKQS